MLTEQFLFAERNRLPRVAHPLRSARGGGRVQRRPHILFPIYGVKQVDLRHYGAPTTDPPSMQHLNQNHVALPPLEPLLVLVDYLTWTTVDCRSSIRLVVSSRVGIFEYQLAPRSHSSVAPAASGTTQVAPGAPATTPAGAAPDDRLSTGDTYQHFLTRVRSPSPSMFLPLELLQLRALELDARPLEGSHTLT